MSPDIPSAMSPAVHSSPTNGTAGREIRVSDFPHVPIAPRLARMELANKDPGCIQKKCCSESSHPVCWFHSPESPDGLLAWGRRCKERKEVERMCVEYHWR